MSKDTVDLAIIRLYKSGASISEIHRTLRLSPLKYGDIARVIAQSEISIEYNHTEFNDNYLIVQSIMNFDFKIYEKTKQIL